MQPFTCAPADLPFCPVEDTVAVIGGKWKPLILFHLRSGARRFNELQRLLSQSSARMLALHLRELEADDLIRRTDHHEVPPRVDYTLTEKGRSLTPVLDAMADWGLQFGARRDLAATLLQQDLSLRGRP